MGKRILLQRVSLDQMIAVAAASISVVFLLAFGTQIVEIYRLRGALAIADEGVGRLRAEQVALQATLAYVQTDGYVESVARAEMNKIRPGDQRFVVVTLAAPAATAIPVAHEAPPAPPAGTTYADAWWELLFGS